MSLVTVKVMVKRRDPKDAEKEISGFEDYSLNPDAVDGVVKVPGDKSCVVKLRCGESIMARGSRAQFEKAMNL